jgi:hypothetical protein
VCRGVKKPGVPPLAETSLALDGCMGSTLVVRDICTARLFWGPLSATAASHLPRA